VAQRRFDPARPVKQTVHTVIARPADPHCPSRYLTLMIYPDVEQMRAGAHAYNQRRGQVSDDGNWDALGVTQSSPLGERYDRRTRSWVDCTGRHIGVVRLARGWLTPEVLAHEATHAALHVERMHQWAQAHTAGLEMPDAVEITDDNEEPFAAVAGQLANILARTVHELVVDGWCEEPGYRFVGQS
jgi:hypothetical protein